MTKATSIHDDLTHDEVCSIVRSYYKPSKKHYFLSKAEIEELTDRQRYLSYPNFHEALSEQGYSSKPDNSTYSGVTCSARLNRDTLRRIKSFFTLVPVEGLTENETKRFHRWDSSHRREFRTLKIYSDYYLLEIVFMSKTMGIHPRELVAEYRATELLCETLSSEKHSSRCCYASLGGFEISQLVTKKEALDV